MGHGNAGIHFQNSGSITTTGLGTITLTGGEDACVA